MPYIDHIGDAQRQVIFSPQKSYQYFQKRVSDLEKQISDWQTFRVKKLS